MENGEAADGNLHHHQVQDLNGNNNIDGDIIMGSVVAVVVVFVIAAIIGVYCFYKKNFMNKGHAKIVNEDIDDEEDEIEMNVTHDIIEETEQLN